MNEFNLDEDSSGMLKRAWRVIEILLWTFMLAILNETLRYLNPETLIDNWGIGLIGMMFFVSLYIINDIKFFLFKLNKLNFFFITFFLGWIIVDWADFIATIYETTNLFFGN